MLPFMVVFPEVVLTVLRAEASFCNRLDKVFPPVRIDRLEITAIG